MAADLSGPQLNEWISYYEIDSLLQSEMSKGKSPKAAVEYALALEDLRKT